MGTVPRTLFCQKYVTFSSKSTPFRVGFAQKLSKSGQNDDTSVTFLLSFDTFARIPYTFRYLLSRFISLVFVCFLLLFRLFLKSLAGQK